MADDSQGDKTEAPTPRRRTEAREQGNIARSPDLVAAVLLVCMMIMLGWYGPGIVKALQELMTRMFSEASLDSGTNGLHNDFLAAVRAIAGALAPLMVGACLIAVVVNLFQVGLFFDMKRLQPNFAALNPTKGLSKVFGGGNGNFVRLLMGLAKMLLVSFVAYSAVHGKISLILSAQHLTFMQAFRLGAGLVYSIILRIGLVLFVLSILDYIYQRFRIEKA